ncbi:MAG TPA: alpha/beta fold hydrolase [Candidatus Baltobacteraceae bacterium]|nr:alpha/beta fold hydrolase [Candidatus Baltobacteraceae bacterium]
MGTSILFTRPDGKTAPGYLADADGTAPGVVMFEEWWGLNEQIKETADRLASEGFRVVVPDLYRGQVADTRERAGHLSQGLDFGDAATQDARGAAAHLQQLGSKNLAVMGFCMGGALAMLAAMHDREFDAAVTWYGYPPPEAGDPASIAIPLQGHWAKHDEFFNADGVDALDKKLKAANVAHEFHRYDAKHGFYNPEGLGNYDREAAESAWRRTVEFLHRTLGA